ncbi:hypothetical protein NC653_010025 [Populus alba x Populus x berolinensis]|uniref:Uncharacterized protein n=1 Tax=Populus alba x Populus x berolinensis TaxID=444605 RepID=A0AAD6RBM6_9ROSI|nr:hypothetical protein NC653_010025 [Populus alba x Populus x berolinensis]
MEKSASDNTSARTLADKPTRLALAGSIISSPRRQIFKFIKEITAQKRLRRRKLLHLEDEK